MDCRCEPRRTFMKIEEEKYIYFESVKRTVAINRDYNEGRRFRKK